jgi:hypothetical protein
LALLGAAVVLCGCDKYGLDRQMAELCKKDGGVKVYATVQLSPAEYEKVFRYKVVAKSQDDYYGPDYRYVSSSNRLVGRDGDAERGRGELRRIYAAIYRRSDERLLGESVWYSRVGGDLVTFGFQPSGKVCPNPRTDLAQLLFIREL